MIRTFVWPALGAVLGMAVADPAFAHLPLRTQADTLPDGTVLPEFDRFALAGWDAAYGKVGKNLARLLAIVRGSLVVLTGRPAR